MWVSAIFTLTLVSSCVHAAFTSRKNSKLPLVIIEKNEEIADLTSKLNEYKLIARILTDQVTFLKGSIHYYKKMALDERKEKENIRRTLLARLEGLETNYQSQVDRARAEVRKDHENKVNSLKSQFEVEKKQLLDNMEKGHRKEIEEIKRGFQSKLDKADEKVERKLTDVKAKLKDEKSKAPSNNVATAKPVKPRVPDVSSVEYFSSLDRKRRLRMAQKNRRRLLQLEARVRMFKGALFLVGDLEIPRVPATRESSKFG